MAFPLATGCGPRSDTGGPARPAIDGGHIHTATPCDPAERRACRFGRERQVDRLQNLSAYARRIASAIAGGSGLEPIKLRSHSDT